jgi:hypothetical protein
MRLFKQPLRTGLAEVYLLPIMGFAKTIDRFSLQKSPIYLTPTCAIALRKRLLGIRLRKEDNDRVAKAFPERGREG